MSAPMKTRTTAAYHVQAVLSFALSGTALAAGIACLPVGAWTRAFLGLGLLYTVTSAFTLAKVIRDRQESNEMVTRVDQARLDKLLSEHDPFKVEGV
ncbi:YiaA/YiaB family inner membrane protein [Kitasatospora brasiliensis]|uniref:YiaA/YiaB family inner membrane protein n=1 Tax=Kitasatospora brasiliensis TaxID=3058040 RepID=UPI00292CB4F7|nr:YiaA/YiaB family inner membrane protein [Kitasatospora sp. K002]